MSKTSHLGRKEFELIEMANILNSSHRYSDQISNLFVRCISNEEGTFFGGTLFTLQIC